jgi:hypothetical protein
MIKYDSSVFCYLCSDSFNTNRLTHRYNETICDNCIEEIIPLADSLYDKMKENFKSFNFFKRLKFSVLEKLVYNRIKLDIWKENQDKKLWRIEKNGYGLEEYFPDANSVYI